MALTVTITSHNQVTRDVEYEVPIEDAEAAAKAKAEAEAAVQKITRTEHVGWDVAASIAGSWGSSSSTFFADLPETATEEELAAWVKAKYAE